MLPFGAGVSSLRASQTALETIANNIANANTPSYKRQVARLAESTPIANGTGLKIGSGVDVVGITQLRDSILEESINSGISNSASTAAQLSIAQQIETLFTPRPGSISDRVGQFFNAVEALTRSPNDASLRQGVVAKAGGLADEINTVVNELDRIREHLRPEVERTVSQINNLSETLAELNQDFAVVDGGNSASAEQGGRRDQVIGELAELIDVRVGLDGGRPIARIASNSALISKRPIELRVDTQGESLTVTQDGSPVPFKPASGKLQGLLKSYNSTLPAVRERLDEFANSLIGLIDKIHARGVGNGGSFDVISSERPVSSVDAPLAQAGTVFPVSKGELFVSVIDTTTGKSTLTSIAVDPAVQSLRDVADAISSVANIQAVVNATTGQLAITAADGYRFDFTGRLATTPSGGTYSGTSEIELAGVYRGSKNDKLTISIVGSGQIGVDDNLRAEVRDSSGVVRAQLDIGRDYEPGTLLAVGDGASVRFGNGQVIDGETIAFDIVADSDTAGLLPALGINSLFSGSTASDLSVSNRVLTNSENFASSISGLPGDGSNLQALLDLRQARRVGSSNLTFEQFIGGVVADSGRTVSELNQISENQALLGQQLENQRASFSGVNPDEELLNMLKFQRSYQASAKFISVVDKTLDDLFQIVR